ncbi:MAG: glycoside hydrolase family 130 protein [Deltaproteobacteria bacterium]|nr:glycoside hydrolase family 130 protein [Deltaproteobacteria bacterium]MBW1921606.1 glycoside hydrolase family 130 protein [Deltaproteobacteria bacterium]MBW1935366.1 glycoside hydrolase family 130 protein [Deltaproteobacteria bacterium]MBW1978168.1 glycoside hydrolase family 130 protein [Deltaproteobacteria bacterium]MBW2045428.1 glycoside hydrolase family 130 protein [Deltaproteobacteria bacterium]
MFEHLSPFKRFSSNPILTREDIPYPCNTVFNAGACKFEDRYILLLRVEDLTGVSHLTLAYSDDGYKFTVSPSPWILPSSDPYYEVYERYGIEDPRITRIGKEYYVAYTALGAYGPRVGIAQTRDFVHFERVALATEVDNKDAALFPEKINSLYVMIDRPSAMGQRKPSIWINYSPDLVYWGKAHALLAPEPGWGSTKVGVSTPPVKTKQGWIVLYHGVRDTAGGRLYRIGALLLDLEDPENILGYTPYFIFSPEEQYERTGDVPNVVFPCGLVAEDDGIVKMYYGAADTCIGLAEARLEDLVECCLSSKA